MRILFSLLFICLLQQVGSTQTPRPSQKEIQAQMQEAKREAKTQIVELENQIAEAKLKEEAPEAIKEMETRLATMKKMLGVIDDAFSTSNKKPKNLPATKTVLPKYVSPIIPIPLRQPVVAPTEAQAKDRLLWYKGKKIDDSTIVTTGKMVVRYSKKRNMVILKPDEPKDTLFTELLKTLSQTEKMKDEYVVQTDRIQNSFFLFPEIFMSYREFDLLRQRYEKIIMNTIDLPDPVSSAQLYSPNTNNAAGNRVSANSNVIQPRDVDEILEILNDKMKESIILLQLYHNELKSGTKKISSPPERPNNLCLCEEIDEIPSEYRYRAKFESELKNWFDDFWKEEEQLLDLYKRIYQHLEDRGTRNWTLATPPDLDEVLKDAIHVFVEVKSQKIWELTKLVERGNIYLEDGLVTATLAFEKMLRDFQVKDLETERLAIIGAQRIDRVRDYFFKKKVFENYMNQQKSARNYNVLFDISVHMNHEYSKQALDRKHDALNYFMNYWQPWIDRFNRFNFSVTMEFQVDQVDNDGKVVMSADGSLESKVMKVRLGNYHCKWQIHLLEPDYRNRNATEDSFYVPIKVLGGKKKFFPTNKPPIIINYSAPAYMEMVLQPIRIGFCDQTPDSIIMNVLRYSSDDIADHANDKFDRVYTTDMGFFANKMIFGIKKTEANADQLIDIAGRAMNLQGNGPLPHSTGHNLLDESLMDFIMSERKQELQGEMSEVSHTEKTVILFYENNGASVFHIPVHSTVDLNDLDKKLIGLRLVKGLITVKIEHTPLP